MHFGSRNDKSSLSKPDYTFIGYQIMKFKAKISDNYCMCPVSTPLDTGLAPRGGGGSWKSSQGRVYPPLTPPSVPRYGYKYTFRYQ